MKRIALITSSKHPDLIDGDNKLAKPFNEHGINISAIPWDKPNIIWNNFDVVILRSCWDHIKRIDEFTKWINKLEAEKVNLWNPISVIRKNIDKNYLIELEKKSILIIPTRVFTNKSAAEIPEYLRSLKEYKEIIIKPIIGNEAHNVIKLPNDSSTSTIVIIHKMIKENDILVQPFLKEIEREGEYSFIFFDKKYSHSVIKKPNKSDYRTQLSFGGSEQAIVPADILINQAQKVINSIESPLLYGRVDGINV